MQEWLPSLTINTVLSTETPLYVCLHMCFDSRHAGK